MTDKLYIRQHINYLKQQASHKYGIPQETCHLGHVLLQGMLDNPDFIHQIDAATDERETSISVAKRSMRLASAMNNYSLKPGDVVVIMGFNHINVCIPFYACHFNGYSTCTIDPSITPDDLQALFPYLKPKIVFCESSCVDKVKDAFKLNNMLGEIITFDDKTNNLETFVLQHKGTDVDFTPALFDHGSITAWLMLTSGTTGLPKVAIIPFKTLLNSLCCWWDTYSESIGLTLAMATLQWLSSLIFFVSTPLRCYTRLQCSKPLNPAFLISIIKKYKPNATAWTPFLLGQFLLAAENGCDLTSFKTILIAGGIIEKSILDRFRKLCPAYLQLVYSMTELMVPIFHFNEDTPEKSTGSPLEKYEYKLVGEDGKPINESFKTGELYLKGNDFFAGYLNNPEETKKMITEDGWLKTGDMFYRDKRDFFYFVERKRLLIRCNGTWVPPLELEAVLKTHPGVAEACVVSYPDIDFLELPVAMIMRRNGDRVEPEELFALMRKSLPPTKQLFGGLFFVESFPTTVSGKIARSQARELALTAQRILPESPSL